MRGALRRRQHEEEEESVFVSMTDMTVSFLFIVMLLLAFFASQYDATKAVPLPEHERVLAQLDEARSSLAQREEDLRQLRAEIMRLRAEQQQLLADLETLKQSLIEVTAERDAARAEVAALLAELERLREPDPLEAYINRSNAERRRILEQLKEQLTIDFPDLQVVLSEQSDALRFQGDGLFRSGAATVRPDRRAIVEQVATRLQAILPCYTLGNQSRWSEGCNPGAALIEAVQIEGHTDAIGEDFVNLQLSTARANETFRIMTVQEPTLAGHLNIRGQPVISVAGYGEMRPVTGNETDAERATNRRIDLRLIMQVPARSEEIQTIRSALTAGLPRAVGAQP